MIRRVIADKCITKNSLRITIVSVSSVRSTVKVDFRIPINYDMTILVCLYHY